MSILLEALRKTEKNQHLRETPTIHTDNQPVPVSEPFPIRWLVILLVVAMLVIGWFFWRQYQQPAGIDPAACHTGNRPTSCWFFAGHYRKDAC